MFEQLRDTLRGLGRIPGYDERRSALAGMKDALVHARLALKDLGDAVGETESRIASERAELEKLSRRRGMASDINDAETVAVADRFIAQHSERLTVLEQKLLAQQSELALVQREYDEMTTELKRAMAGIPPQGSVSGLSHEEAAMREVEEALGENRKSNAEEAELEAMFRARARQDRESEASRRLAELKKKFGKET